MYPSIFLGYIINLALYTLTDCIKHSAFRMRVNLPKNRYTDVLCYDHSRVILPIRDADEASGYINANFVDGYMQKNAFISTQGMI